MTMIAEYKKDLSVLRKQREKHKKNESERKTISNMISSTEYSLFWLENGYERPPIDNSPTKQSKDKREELWGEIQHVKGIEQGVCDTYFWEESEQSRLTDRQIKRLYDVHTIMSGFSNQELNVFVMRYQELLEVKIIATALNTTEKAINKTIERLSKKINAYFDNLDSHIDLLLNIGGQAND